MMHVKSEEMMPEIKSNCSLERGTFDISTTFRIKKSNGASKKSFQEISPFATKDSIK